MPDISMCAHPSCPLSSRCYRHEDSGTRPNVYRQAYGTHFAPSEDNPLHCATFVDANEWQKWDADHVR